MGEGIRYEMPWILLHRLPWTTHCSIEIKNHGRKRWRTALCEVHWWSPSIVDGEDWQDERDCRKNSLEVFETKNETRPGGTVSIQIDFPWQRLTLLSIHSCKVLWWAIGRDSIWSWEWHSKTSMAKPNLCLLSCELIVWVQHVQTWDLQGNHQFLRRTYRKHIKRVHRHSPQVPSVDLKDWEQDWKEERVPERVHSTVWKEFEVGENHYSFNEDSWDNH
jgi:hypothetical protein